MPTKEGVDAGNAEAGPPIDYGLLSVDTRPSSRVFHGRQELGSTPLSGIELPAGSYTLVFRLDDGQRFERTVSIRSGRTTRRQFELEPEAEEEPRGDDSRDQGATSEVSPGESRESSSDGEEGSTSAPTRGPGRER
jgi:hypothetical protein